MNTSHLDRGRLAGGLLGATIIAGLLPRFLQALLLMMRKEGLPDYTAVLCEYFAMILAGCLLAYTLGGIKRAGKIMLFSGFWILFVSAVITMIGSLPLFRTDHMGIRIFWFCLSILRLLGMGFFAAVFVLHGLDRAEEFSFSKRCKTAASLFLPILILAATLGLTEALTGSLDASFVSGGTIPFSVSAYLTRALIVALLDFALLFFPVLFLVRSAEKKLDKRNEKTESADAEPSAETESTAPARTSPLIAVIPLVGILVSVLLLWLFTPSSSDKILAGINTYTEQAALLYAMGDYTGTMKNIENLDGVLCAWNSALVEDDLQELEKIVQEYPSNEQIRFLYADGLLRQDPEKAVSRLKQEILRNPYERAWVFAYLKSLKEAQKASEQFELSEAEQAFRDETILTLITSDLYVDDNLYLSGLSSRKQQKLKEQLDPSMMDGIKEDFLAADLEMERIQSGYSTRETLDKWLEIAERYPESFTAQGFALSTGYGYLTANETMEKKSNGQVVLSEEETHSLGSVIDRYDAMFQTMVLEADLSEEDKAQTIVDEKYDLASLLIEFDAAKALEFTKKASEETDDASLEEILVTLSLRNEDYETALPILEKSLQADPEDIYNHYLLILATLRSGEVDRALEEMAVFANRAVSRPGPQDEGAMLMALADTVVNGDVSLKKGALGDDVFTSLYYNLTPQQTATLKESPYLTELLDCDYQYRFWSHGLEEQEQLDAYLDLEKRMLALAEEAPHLSCSYYMLGNLYGYSSIGGSLSGEGGAIDNEKAIEYYRKSLEIDPEQAVVWYSLAQTLDEEEQYKAAYEAATKAYELAAGDYNQAWGETFHGYGTIVHVNSLLVHLENYLRQNPE